MPKQPAPARPFSRTPLTRERLRDITRQAFEPLAFVHAMWEGGSAAFDRDDVWSDMDVQVCVEDERVAETFSAIEAALEKAVGIDLAFAVPEPAWHGHAQRFYRFHGQPTWLMLDLVVQKRSSENRFLEREIHGAQEFLFDKIGLAGTQKPLDAAAWEKKLRARLEHLRLRTAMFAHLVEKECRRKRVIDAMAFYHSMILAPLVELLRIRHDPWRHNFGMRYLHTTLPGAQAKRLEDLLFVRNFPDLQAKQRVALRWFEDLSQELARAPKLVFSSGGVTPVRRSAKV